MYAELEAERLAHPGRLPVYIAGVNEAGHESGFGFLVTSYTRPWVQDRAPDNAYSRWGVGMLRPSIPGVFYRDVIVLDKHNRAIAVYNLTAYDLAVPANYVTLKEILRAAATP